jgi:hypothetical protein
MDGLKKATADYLNVWEDYSFEVERMIDLGDCVLVLEAQTARDGAAARSSVRTWAHCSRSGTSRIVRWEYYWERSDALEAAGIAE